MGGLVQPGKAAFCMRLRAARGIRGKLLCGPGKPGKLIMPARKCLQTCRGGPQYRLRRGGPWQTLLPGVYLAASGIPSMSQKEMAAVLYAGPGSLVTGPMALLHHS